jgi:hypothetical protein
VIGLRQRLHSKGLFTLASLMMQAGLRSPCGCPPYLLLPRVSPCAREHLALIKHHCSTYSLTGRPRTSAI